MIQPRSVATTSLGAVACFCVPIFRIPMLSMAYITTILPPVPIPNLILTYREQTHHQHVFLLPHGHQFSPSQHLRPSACLPPLPRSLSLLVVPPVPHCPIPLHDLLLQGCPDHYFWVLLAPPWYPVVTTPLLILPPCALFKNRLQHHLLGYHPLPEANVRSR